MNETLEQVQARHRKEVKELQSRITNKKKNATKKNRKGVNDECAELERQMKERQGEELRKFLGGDEETNPEDEEQDGKANGSATATTDPDVDSVTDKLRATSVDGGEQPTQGQAQAGNGSGKKRNRQKERLARRAAEQEAAAAAAETEASGMVDHRGIEKAYMTREFKAHALREKDIEPDGHCLFSAVADQLEANEIPLVVGGEVVIGAGAPGGEGYKIVRRVAAEYMEGHRGDFEGFLEEPLETYVAKIRDTAEWGGQLELSALANAYGVEIKVVQDGRTEVVRPLGEVEDLKTLWLAYYRYGYGLGEHYNSLRKAS
ncbi:hypothetical protein B0T14DRAFT_539682 [Immersiella caudata]|uniref:OTU domain-containing protein n=1 Tax=Immersiella caudata TaxID=314043 RepID=A0AA40BUG1_9PEZI|nr:hypothetical protein B0T14DRAFT_539682 [Immersiella caudata]